MRQVLWKLLDVLNVAVILLSSGESAPVMKHLTAPSEDHSSGSN